ncbi:unnamed protein product [Discula destructiva]
MVKRQAQEERERKEAQELEAALKVVAKDKAEAAVKQERIRTAKEARRKTQVQYTYAGYMTVLEELNDFQRDLLEQEHRRDTDHLNSRILETVDGLQRKHEAKVNLLKASSKVKIDEKKKELEQTWLDRISQERETVECSESPHTIQWNPVQWDQAILTDGLCQEVLPEEQDVGYEHLKKRKDSLERFQYVLDEEVAIQQELVDNKKDRIMKSFNIQEHELQVKARSQLHWHGLVVTERQRLLEEFLAVELADEILDEDDNRWNSVLVR